MARDDEKGRPGEQATTALLRRGKTYSFLTVFCQLRSPKQLLFRQLKLLIS
jgi:hypothetical protein